MRSYFYCTKTIGHQQSIMSNHQPGAMPATYNKMDNRQDHQAAPTANQEPLGLDSLSDSRREDQS